MKRLRVALCFLCFKTKRVDHYRMRLGEDPPQDVELCIECKQNLPARNPITGKRIVVEEYVPERHNITQLTSNTRVGQCSSAAAKYKGGQAPLASEHRDARPRLAIRRKDRRSARRRAFRQ